MINKKHNNFKKNKMNTNRSKLLGGVLALVVAFAGVGFAGATLTMDATSITGSANVTIDGVAASIYSIGATTTTGTITIGGTAQEGAVKLADSTAALALSLGTGATGIKTIHIGDGATANILTIGSDTGAASMALKVGTGNFTLNGVAGSTYTIGAATTTGTITIGGTAQEGAISIGNVSTLPVVNLGGTVHVNSAGAGAVGISTSATDVTALQVNLKSDTDGTLDGDSLMGGYFQVSNTSGGTNMTHRQLQGILVGTTMWENAFAAYGVQGHVSVKAGAVSPNSGYIVGLSGKVTLADNVATGAVAAGLFTLDSSVADEMRTPANANGISVNIVDTTIASIIDATTNDGGAATNGLNVRGTMTNGLNLSSATIAGEGIILPTQAKDVTCTAGGIIYDGTNFWGCTATNTYTKLDN